MILVFGRTGQVATELARHEGVRCLGRAEADLRDPASCIAAIEKYRPKAIINAAAYTAVDKAEEEVDLAMVVNGEAPGTMAKAAAELGSAFVHISTDYVFDGVGETPFTPDHPTAPLGAYGRSKLAGERTVLEAHPGAVVLRTSWVFSSHGSNFLKTMLRLTEARDRLTIVADQIGGPTPAADIAEACLTIVRTLSSGEGCPGIHHFSGAPDVSWAAFAREIIRAADRDVAVVDISTADYSTLAARPLNSRLNCSSLKNAFGIERPDWRLRIGAIVQELKDA